jgi:hypothetical protein
MSLDVSAYWDTSPIANNITVTNFQTTNIQLTSPVHGGDAVNVVASNVQAGTFDFSQTYKTTLNILTASNASGGATQTYVVLADTIDPAVNTTLQGDTITVRSGTQRTDAWGNTLTTNGSTSLLDFYDHGGSNAVNVTASQISSNLFMGAGSSQPTSGGGSMSFIPSGTRAGVEAQVFAAGGDLIQLNASGSGAASIFTDLASGLLDIEGFQFGRDSLDMILPSGTSTTSGYSVAGTNDSAWVSGTAGPTASLGVIFTGLSAASVVAHESSAVVGGVTHLYIH